jgi:hypothetical protein
MALLLIRLGQRDWDAVHLLLNVLLEGKLLETKRETWAGIHGHFQFTFRVLGAEGWECQMGGRCAVIKAPRTCLKVLHLKLLSRTWYIGRIIFRCGSCGLIVGTAHLYKYEYRALLMFPPTTGRYVTSECHHQERGCCSSSHMALHRSTNIKTYPSRGNSVTTRHLVPCTMRCSWRTYQIHMSWESGFRIAMCWAGIS